MDVKRILHASIKEFSDSTTILTEQMYFDIIIIGGGASGMCAAISAKTDNNSVLIIDKDTRPGRKILATGNGKCNLTNSYCEVPLFYKNPEGIYPYFSEGDKSFIENVINTFNWKDTLEFFEELGIFTLNKNSYIYPRPEQASAVLEGLEYKIREEKIETAAGYAPKRIKKTGGFFRIDNRYESKYLVLASGGLSSPKNDADGFGYAAAESFGHSIVRPRPALCGIPCKGKIFKTISGVRQDGLLSVYDRNHKLIIKCYGNIQFTDYGISGIPAFQISSCIGKMLEEGRQPVIEIDMFPGLSAQKTAEIIKRRSENHLLGMVNSKLAGGFEKTALDEGLKPGTDAYINRLSRLVHCFKVTAQAMPSFKNSQVTAGGVSTSEINARSMESKKTRDLYVIGELLDVNGICGGYNLQWAWSTGYICGSALKRKYDKNNIS